MGLGSDHLIRGHEDRATIRDLDLYGFELKSLNQGQINKVVQIVTLSHKATCGFDQSEFNDEV